MSTIIINISKRAYSTRNRALGIAKQAISREMNILTAANGDPLFWTLDNVVVEEAEDGWRWHVEIDMPSTDSAMDEIEAQEEEPDADEELDIEAFFDACRQRKIPDTVEMVDAFREMEESISDAEAGECMALFIENAEARAGTTWRKPSAVMVQWVIAGLAVDGYGEKLEPTAHELQMAATWDAEHEAPRELTVEQALEIAAQQTEAVNEEFNAVEARRKAESEQKNEALQHMLDFNQSDIDVATDMGHDALETVIERLEDTLRGLRRRLKDYNLALRNEAHSKGDYLAWAANDLRNADFNDLRLVLAEQAGKLKALGTARVHIKFFSEK